MKGLFGTKSAETSLPFNIRDCSMITVGDCSVTIKTLWLKCARDDSTSDLWFGGHCAVFVTERQVL